jgi:hypothetical protein
LNQQKWRPPKQTHKCQTQFQNNTPHAHCEQTNHQLFAQFFDNMGSTVIMLMPNKEDKLNLKAGAVVKMGQALI